MKSKKKNIEYPDLQSVIDRIYDPLLEENELLLLLRHRAGRVRANVLMILPCRKIVNKETVVSAIVLASSDEGSSFKMMGATNIKRFAIATLVWLKFDLARQAFEAIWQTLDEDDRFFVGELVRQEAMKDLYEDYRARRKAGPGSVAQFALPPVFLGESWPKQEK